MKVELVLFAMFPAGILGIMFAGMHGSSLTLKDRAKTFACVSLAVFVYMLGWLLILDRIAASALPAVR